MCSRRGERFERLIPCCIFRRTIVFGRFFECVVRPLYFLEDFHMKLAALLLFVTLSAAAQTPFSGRYVKYAATAGPGIFRPRCGLFPRLD